MGGNVNMPSQCDGCYYINKVESQKATIIRCQSANKHYKERISQLEQQVKVRDRKIRGLEQQVHDWAYAVNYMPWILRRWALWRYSRRS